MEEGNLSRLSIDKSVKVKGSKRPSRVSYFFIITLIGIASIAIVFWMVLSKGVEVKVASASEVYPSQILTRLNASGYVVAQRKADVAAKITGQLVSLSVKEGSLVREGQVMARLEDADIRALVDEGRSNLEVAQKRLEQAKADLNNATLEFDRRKGLIRTGAISRSEFDAAQARYLGAMAFFEGAMAAVKSSSAALKNIEATLSYTEIRAPFDAVVLTKNADIGDIITPLGAAANAKAAVVTIADLSSLEVEADVSESNIGAVHRGQPCDITLDALPGERFPGEVDTIVPTVDRSKATVLVKVRFLKRDQRILPEMSTKVGFLSRPVRKDEQGSRTMVVSSAIVHLDKGDYVFIAREGKAVKKDVRAGQRFGDMVEVLSGLKPGDVVVVDPPHNLRDESKITVFKQ